MSFASIRLRRSWRSKSQENASHFLLFPSDPSAQARESMRESMSISIAATGCDNLRRTLARGSAAPSMCAPFYPYGRYRRGGAHITASNAELDAGLRARSAACGVSDLVVAACACYNVLPNHRSHNMPANNLSVVFRRSSATVEGDMSAAKPRGPKAPSAFSHR